MNFELPPQSHDTHAARARPWQLAAELEPAGVT